MKEKEITMFSTLFRSTGACNARPGRRTKKKKKEKKPCWWSEGIGRGGRKMGDGVNAQLYMRHLARLMLILREDLPMGKRERR